MTIKKDGPEQGRAGEAQGGAGAPKKPTATIELKATEIKTEVAKAAEAAKADAGKAADAVKTEAGKVAEAVKADVGKVAEKAGEAAKSAATKVDAAWTDKREAGKPTSGKTDSGSKTDTGKATSAMSDEGAERPAAPAQRRSGIGGFFTHLAAGVVGGFLALMGADTIGQKLLPELGLPAPNAAANEATAALQKRLDALEAAPKTAVSDAGGQLAAKLAAAEQRLAEITGLKQEQAKLAAETKALAEKLGSGGGNDQTPRIVKLEERLASLVAAAGAEPGKSVPQLAAVTGKIADVEQTVGNQLAAIRKTIGEQIEARVNSVAEAAELAKSGTARLDKDVAAVKTDTVRIKADTERLGQGMRTMQEEAATLKSAVDGLRGDLDSRIKTTAKPADVSAAVGPVATKLQQLESSVAGVVRNEDNRRANAERILLSLELGNLKRTIDRGGPFAAELADVRKAAGSKIDFAALEQFKDRGVAPLADLVRDFRGVATAVLDADAEPAGGGIVDRLIAGAKSVVRVRKVSAGAQEQGTEPSLARMETALREGRLADVLAEAAKLPAKAAVPAHDWLVKVEARNTVDRAISTVETTLKAALAAGPEAAANGTATKPAATEKK